MQNRTQTRLIAINMEKPDTEINEQIKYSAANFRILYRQYATRVYRYIFARVNNHADAEDLTAQVFMAAMKGLKKFTGDGNFAAWLFTIARNKVADNYRRNKPVVSLDAEPDIVAEDGDPLSQITHKEKFDDLSRLLKDLPPEQQEILQLRFAGELTYSQIGLVVGKTEAAIKMATHRLLRQLQIEMEQNNE